LYVSELVEQVQQDSIVDPEQLRPPASACRLVRQRLAALDAETLSVLESASVIGAQFCLPRLALVAGRKPAALMPALDRAREAALVRCVGRSTTHFAFTQLLLHRTHVA
jgi:predicted ATPase